MAERTENSWIKSNTEYEKLKGRRRDGSRPQETPRRQGAGKRGHEKPDYSRWTTGELRKLAATLGIEDAQGKPRADLLDRIEDRDAASRGRR